MRTQRNSEPSVFQKFMLFKTNILSVCIFLFCGVCSAARDVNNVSFRGDSTIFGMKIEKTYFAEGSFLVVTTGARFEYVKGELKMYQGLRNDITTTGESPAAPWEEVATAVISKATLVEQPKGKELEYRIVGVNKAGDSEPSNTAMVVL